MNATPTCPLDVAELLITGAASGLIVMLILLLPVPPALEAVTVTGVLPALVGVPEISPLEVSTDSPAGSSLAPKVVGPSEAAIW